MGMKEFLEGEVEASNLLEDYLNREAIDNDELVDPDRMDSFFYYNSFPFIDEDAFRGDLQSEGFNIPEDLDSYLTNYGDLVERWWDQFFVTVGKDGSVTNDSFGRELVFAHGVNSLSDKEWGRSVKDVQERGLTTPEYMGVDPGEIESIEIPVKALDRFGFDPGADMFDSEIRFDRDYIQLWPGIFSQGQFGESTGFLSDRSWSIWLTFNRHQL